MKKHINKIIIAVAIIGVLVFTFFVGGNYPSPQQVSQEEVRNTEYTEIPEPQMEIQPLEKEVEKNEKQVEEPIKKEPEVSDKKEETVIKEEELTCTLLVRCDTIKENLDWFDKEKIDVLPENGVIFPEQTVIFYEGESVFNVLLREMKKNKIHLEYMNTPIYDSAYIEGIGNIYEFDCGELSGWMYKVNGEFPGYGSSRYILEKDDKIEWVYTCNLGKDIGGENSARNGMIYERI